MIDPDTLPQETGLMTMQNHHPRIATPDEHGRYRLPASSWSYTPTPHTAPA